MFWWKQSVWWWQGVCDSWGWELLHLCWSLCSHLTPVQWSVSREHLAVWSRVCPADQWDCGHLWRHVSGNLWWPSPWPLIMTGYHAALSRLLCSRLHSLWWHVSDGCWRCVELWQWVLSCHQTMQWHLLPWQSSSLSVSGCSGQWNHQWAWELVPKIRVWGIMFGSFTHLSRQPTVCLRLRLSNRNVIYSSVHNELFIFQELVVFSQDLSSIVNVLWATISPPSPPPHVQCQAHVLPGPPLDHVTATPPPTSLSVHTAPPSPPSAQLSSSTPAWPQVDQEHQHTLHYHFRYEHELHWWGLQHVCQLHLLVWCHGHCHVLCHCHSQADTRGCWHVHCQCYYCHSSSLWLC